MPVRKRKTRGGASASKKVAEMFNQGPSLGTFEISGIETRGGLFGGLQEIVWSILAIVVGLLLALVLAHGIIAPTQSLNRSSWQFPSNTTSNSILSSITSTTPSLSSLGNPLQTPNVLGSLSDPPLQNPWTRFLPNNAQQPFSQVGVLKSTSASGDSLLLPLLGRPVNNRSDKWQYFTTSNTGSVNTKLPVVFGNKDCAGEFGCPEIDGYNNNDQGVFVKGYDKVFQPEVFNNGYIQYNMNA